MDAHLLRFRKDVRYCILDVETFNVNLSFNYNRFWQVGYVTATGDKVESQADFRLNWPDSPHLKISKDAALITGFKQDIHARLAKNEDYYWPLAYKALTEADYVILHNGLRFDIPLISQWYKMHGEDWGHLMSKIIDTNALARGLKLDIKYDPAKECLLQYQFRVLNIKAKGCKTNVLQLCKDYEIEVDESRLHEALYDVDLTFKIWNYLKWKYEI